MRARLHGTLIKHGLAIERETDDAGCIHRVNGDLRYGIFITDAGLAAIGVSESPEAPGPTTVAPSRTTKAATIIALLERAEGATLTPSYLTRVVRLALLAPDVTSAMLAGAQRAGVSLTKLTLGIEIPANWAEQRAILLPP